MFDVRIPRLPSANCQRVIDALAPSAHTHFMAKIVRCHTNHCDGLGRQIDALVYDLCVLTPAEIKIVAGNEN